MDNLTNTGIFLLQTIVTIYSVILLIRILLPSLGNNYHNPAAQFVLKMTSFLILPLRRIIRYHRKIDIAAIIILIVLQLIYLYLFAWLQTGYWIDFTPALIWMIGNLLHLLIQILFWAIIADAIISWLATPHRDFSSLHVILFRLTKPVMAPARRFIPPIGGLDISPIPVLIILKAIDLLLILPIQQAGITLAVGGN